MKYAIHSLLILTALVVLLTSGCGRRQLLRGDNAIVVDGLVSVWGDWVKVKRSKLDVRFHIANESADGIVIRRDDLQCSKGEEVGRMRLLRVSRHVEKFVIRTGQSVALTAVCIFEEMPYGDFRILISHVYESRMRPRRGRARPHGDVVGSDIEWVVPEDELE